MAFRIVRDAEVLAAGMDRHVESVFRNVDAHALWPTPVVPEATPVVSVLVKGRREPIFGGRG
jgi:hypothetical protein